MTWRGRREETLVTPEMLEAAIKIGNDAVSVKIALERREAHTIQILNAVYRYMMTGRNAEARVLVGRLITALEHRDEQEKKQDHRDRESRGSRGDGD